MIRVSKILPNLWLVKIKNHPSMVCKHKLHPVSHKNTWWHLCLGGIHLVKYLVPLEAGRRDPALSPGAPTASQSLATHTVIISHAWDVTRTSTLFFFFPFGERCYFLQTLFEAQFVYWSDQPRLSLLYYFWLDPQEKTHWCFLGYEELACK